VSAASGARSGALDFVVSRADWSEARFDEGPAPEPGPGELLFRVDRFALTANNISYAKAGDLLRYWDFFPAPAGFGRIPAMGFADVAASRHPDVREGERVFGFFPMSRYLVIQPGAVGARGIVDAAPHRRGIAPAYNTYSPTRADPTHAPEHEDAHMLMRGLFLTSFLVDDFLAEHGGFGARQVVITSASSKTSIALAWLVQRAGRSAVGLTASRNAAFVKSLGFCDEVIAYDDVESVADLPTVVVDMAGSGSVSNRLHRRLREKLVHHASVGATHFDETPRDPDLPGAAPEFFFAPAQIQKRSREWGADGLNERVGGAWKAFRDASSAWLEVERGAGRSALERAYRETLAGRTPPQKGHVLSLWP
jgi:NADPH:quinone reductase-like Zn-dependent oxidoreductase